MASHKIQIDPVLIAAPCEVVWSILTDFPSYPQWNKFTVKIVSDLELGGPIKVYVATANGKVMRQNFRLEACDSPRLIAWSLPKLIHPWLFRAYREQHITPVSENSCEYRTSDEFSGLAAGWIYKSQRDWVAKNFATTAIALKERAESAAQASAAGQ